MDQLLNLTLTLGPGSRIWVLFSTLIRVRGSASRLFLSADAQKAGPTSAVTLQWRSLPKSVLDEKTVDILLSTDA